MLAAMSADKPGADPVMQRKMAVVIKHLHAMMDELAVTETELLQVYEFLDRVGANKDMMLLGDHLGLSVRANDIENYHPIGTPPNVIGPLYREEAPFMENPGAMVTEEEPGRHVIVKGQVRDAETGAPLADALLDFWQSNAVGFYEDQDPDMPDYHFRRRIRTDAEGRYAFRTIVPGGYYIANRDTPIVPLMTALGLHSFRPPHIHLMAEHENYRHLTTLIYFEGEPSNDSDCIFSCRPENMARIEPGAPGSLDLCVYDIELVRT
ncbi:dioxygenase [Phaeovulum sp. W22_SRMD_FR3]